MPEQIVYVRGFVPTEFREFLSPAFTADARVVLNLDPSILADLVADLNSQPGFLDRQGLPDLVGRRVRDTEDAKSLVNFIANLDRILRQLGVSEEDFLERFPTLLRDNIGRAGSTEVAEASPGLLKLDEINELARRVSLLFGTKSALARQRKADRLLKSTGHALEELQLICDLRPIFDDERARVDGMLPMTTLRVVATGDNGMPIALEARVSLPQLEDLQKKVGLAMIKLQALAELLNQKGIALPHLAGGKGRDQS